MMILIKNGYILTFDDDDSTYKQGDLLIKGRKIESIGRNLDIDPHNIDTVIDATNKIVMPGLINSHIHSGENLMRGLASGMPNELWNLSIWPPIGGEHFEPRIHYLQILLGAIEMIKNGVTTVQDQERHWYQSPYEGAAEAYFGAITDIGMRLSAVIALIDKPWHETLLDLPDVLPKHILDKMNDPERSTAWQLGSLDELIDICKSAIDQWHGYKDLVSMAIGPESPQRCTRRALLEAGNLARSEDLPLHIHLLETRIQKKFSQKYLNDKTARYLDECGILSDKTSVVHAVWVSQDDIEVLSDKQCCIVHAPVCNLFMGSGVMPMRKFLLSGNPIALASDGCAANGSFSMFETMKFAAVLHTVETPEYKFWPSAKEILKMATHGGARSVGLEDRLGVLAPGKLADIILVDMMNTSFVPLNNIYNQLIFSENGSSVNTVIINGKVVMEDRCLKTIDETVVLEEICSYLPDLRKVQNSAIPESQKLFPYVDKIYRNSCE
jgi:5-methylthioadenosine/S-adenosylhomocysteine deaminase